MPEPLRVLLLEDSPDDAEMLCRELARSGFDARCVRRETREGMQTALQESAWDIIFSDYRMPAFSAPAALQVLQASGLDIPFVVVSGTIGEESAAELIRLGAHDFLMKGSLGKLPATLTRVLREARARREQKLNEVRVRDSQALYHSLVENIPMHVFRKDREGRFTFANSQFCRSLGRPQEEILGKTDADFYPEALVQKYRGDDLRVMAARTLFQGVEEFRGPAGERRFVEVIKTPLCDGSDQVIGVQVILRDITDKINAEQEQARLEVKLRHGQKMEAIGQLAAGIAHEINTPNQYIGDNIHFLKDGFAQLAACLEEFKGVMTQAGEGALDPVLAKAALVRAGREDLDYLLTEIPRAVDQALEGVERVVRIVRAMKEFSHPASEEHGAIDLNHAIENTVLVSRNEWKYVADLETRLDPSLPPVPCFPGEINQVILNLVVNAAHAIADVVGESGQKGKIIVQTRALGQEVEIRVQDTGTGIPEDLRAKVFDPFFTTKPVGKGTGQGLAIAYSVVVEKHRGSITLESTVGEGTTFIVRLPSHAEKAALAGTNG
jgi:two-component system, NtrC family, sensor kinase